LTSLWTQIAAGLCWVVYGSFFEWYWHKLWMHTPRPPRAAFHGHTVVHHGLYKGDESYFVAEDQHPEHILLKWYALPGIVLAHLPIMYLFDRYVIHHTLIGSLAATLLYFVVYEYTHWNMHVPRRQFIERFRWFQFLRNHHKLHHRYYQKNFCVLLPLADACLGTLITNESLARQKAERERALANGETLNTTKSRRRTRRGQISPGGGASHSRLAMEFMKFKTRRVRQGRKYRKVDELPDLLPSGRDKSKR
jgi:hypothetical protein